MANQDEALLREVDQELTEERQWAMFRKHGPMVIGAALALVCAVAGWQAWTHFKTQKAEAQALQFKAALDLLETDREAGRAALDTVGDEGGGFGALAQLQRAGSYASSGERLKALEIYRGIASGDAPLRVRELARLRAAYLSLEDGRDEVMRDLGDLGDEGGPFSWYARELFGLASLRAEDYESALSTFRALTIDVNAPGGVRQRAEEFAALASAGKAGVNVTGNLRVDDLVNSLGLDEALDSAATDAVPADDAAIDESAPVEDAGAAAEGAAAAVEAPANVIADDAGEDGGDASNQEE